MPQNLRQRFNVKVWDFNGSHGKCVPNLMKFHLGQIVTIKETSEILPICPWFRRLAFARQKIVAGVIRIILFYDIAEQRGIRDRPNRAFCFGWPDVDVGFPLPFVIDPLHRAVNRYRVVCEGDVAHLQAT